MSKQSIYKATYGLLSEIDRSQGTRDRMFTRGQASYDSMESSSADLDEDSIFAQASKLAMEQAEYDAQLEGFANIDEYAASPEHYNFEEIVGPDGRTYSPGEQLIEDLIKDYADMIKRGEV